jgi:hypothetical protein
MLCIVCEKEVLPQDEKFYLGVDIPYINLQLHRTCWKDIKDNYCDFLPKKKELLYNIVRNWQEKKNNTKK